MNTVSYRVQGELRFGFLVPAAPAGGPAPLGSAGIPYEAEHQAGTGAHKPRMVMDMATAAVDEVPPALLPEGAQQETFLADGACYYRDPTGWQSMSFDPLEALLDMDIPELLPEGIINWLDYAEAVEAAEEIGAIVAYQIELGAKCHQAMKERAQELHAGEEWTQEDARPQQPGERPALGQRLRGRGQAGKHTSEVQIAHAGMVIHLTGPLPEDSPFPDMTFEFRGMLHYHDYGAAADMQLPSTWPRPGRTSRPIIPARRDASPGRGRAAGNP